MNSKYLISIIIAALLSGCVTTTDQTQEQLSATNKHKVKPSYLTTGLTGTKEQGSIKIGENGTDQGTKSVSTTVDHLTSPYRQKNYQGLSAANAQRFSDQSTLQVTTEKMPLSTFINYVFGELLNVSYIVSDTIVSPEKEITLNLQQSISQRKLYELTEDYLLEAGNEINVKDDIFYITPKSKQGQQRTLGLGAAVKDVPVARYVVQIVPLKFGLQTSSIRAINGFSSAKISLDTAQNIVYVEGNYDQVVKALEMIAILDTSAYRSKNIALINLTYTQSDDFIAQIENLLKNEGIESTTFAASRGTVFVPLDRIGAVAVFSTSREAIQRIEYWAKVIDTPVQGSKLNYFLYYPQFARAGDLSESLIPLLANRNSSAPVSKSARTSTPESTQTNVDKKSEKSASVQSSSSLVVDQRSNALIFNMSAAEYNQILPLVKQLDTLPKQVLLEVTIAEVTLTDEFKQGVEFFFEKGNSSIGTKKALGATSAGGLGYVLDTGNFELTANFSQENSNVNVLSNPSLLVRDGVAASINVGTDIPVVTSTVDNSGDESKVTKTIQYRKTGVNVSVTPTVNSRGVVIMEIEQNISNQVKTSVDSDSPSIFDRSLITEVVADDGQTIVLGGLISEDGNSAEKKVPLLGDIPYLGNLFKYQSDSNTKTELVMLITPRIIQRADEWQQIKQDFQAGFDVLEFSTVGSEVIKADKL